MSCLMLFGPSPECDGPIRIDVGHYRIRPLFATGQFTIGGIKDVNYLIPPMVKSSRRHSLSQLRKIR